MPALRREFYKTLRQMLAICDLPLLTDRFPATDPHNISARILRLGVAVSAFSSLENYLQGRTEFLVSQIPPSATVTASLGDELRAFLSIDAIIGLANRIGLTDKSSRQSYVDSQLLALAGYSASPPSFTALGFGPKGSNVSEADVGRSLAVFGIDKPWKRLSNIATEIGSSRVSLKDDFIEIAKTRNRSAHNPASNIPSSDLKTHVETSILIAVCFDCVSAVIANTMAASPSFTSYRSSVAAAFLPYRFVDLEPSGSWVERASDGRRVRKRHIDEAAASSSAASRAGNNIVIIRDQQGVPLAVF